MTDAIFGADTERKSELPVVPSVFGDPMFDPKFVSVPSKAVNVKKSRLVYQMPTMA